MHEQHWAAVFRAHELSIPASDHVCSWQLQSFEHGVALVKLQQLPHALLDGLQPGRIGRVAVRHQVLHVQPVGAGQSVRWRFHRVTAIRSGSGALLHEVAGDQCGHEQQHVLIATGCTGCALQLAHEWAYERVRSFCTRLTLG